MRTLSVQAASRAAVAVASVGAAVSSWHLVTILANARDYAGAAIVLAVILSTLSFAVLQAARASAAGSSIGRLWLLALLMLQVPSVTSSILTYGLFLGGWVIAGITSEGNVVMRAGLGGELQLFLAGSHRTAAIGVNLVPLVLLIGLMNSAPVPQSPVIDSATP